MISAAVVAGIVAAVGIPITIAALTLWYGLNNPNTGLGKWVYTWWPFGQPKGVAERIRAEEQSARQELKAATRDLRPSEVIPAHLKVGNVLEMGADMQDVVGLARLLELKFYGADKANKVHIDPQGNLLREFEWVTLANGDIIANLPNKESGRIVLYYGEDVFDNADVALLSHMEMPGKRFAASNQEDYNVDFEIPGIPGSWLCRDIVWADVQMGPQDGKNRFGSSSGRMTRISSLLAKSTTNDDEFLLFVIMRGGTGDHGLYRLRPFDPNVEVEQIL